MKERYKEQFYFYRSERHGLYALLCIIAVVWAAFAIYPYCTAPDVIDQERLLAVHKTWIDADSVDSERRKAAYRAEYDHRSRTEYKASKPWQKRQYTKKNSAEPPVRQRFTFDPNTLSSDSLKALGFKPWIATNITKYIANGGVFRKPDDLLRIRNIDSGLVNSLLPLIDIKQLAEENPKTIKDYKREEDAPSTSPSIVSIDFIDINSANQYQWMLLPGIGETKARIIVEEREKLGGFHSVEQLRDIWGVDDTLYTEIEAQLELSSPVYRKIQLNLADVDAIAWHKYVSYKKAKIICAYRKHHGPYRSIEDLKKIIAFDEAFIQRIEPYLDYTTEVDDDD